MKRKKRLGSTEKDPKPIADNEQETTPDPKVKLGRRGFLKFGAGAAAVTLANPLESIAQTRAATGYQVRGDCSEETFTQPDVIRPDPDNVTRHKLVAEPLTWTFECGDTKTTGLQPVFNGALPGPTLVADKGTTLELTLTNKLDLMPKFNGDTCDPSGHGDPTKPACFAHTNLHFHGLQVSPCSIGSDGNLQCGHYPVGPKPAPQFSSDDVLIDIFPGKTNKYKVVLPDMHAPGTNWYHSHLHGASAYQVSGGMAGAIIIREPTEEARIVRQDLDKIFLLQEILVNPVSPWPNFPPIYGSLGDGPGAPITMTFVNGQCRPTLRMKKGQMMRWRFINASVTPTGLMKLKVIKTDTCNPIVPKPADTPKGEVIHLMAMDGLSFYGVNPQPVRYHLMALGSRADFLVKFDQPGFYTILKDSYPLESVRKPASTNYTRATNPDFNKNNPNVRQVLMYVYVDNVSGYDDEIPRVIPGEKPAYLDAIWKVDKVRTDPIRFQNPGTGKFQIDGKPFPNNVAIDVGLNTAEEWTLLNESIPPSGNPPGQSNTHPFHVHLNPFQIKDIPFDFEVADEERATFKYPKMDVENPCNWPFWDTVALEGAPRIDNKVATTSMTIRSRFLIYDGEYVTHCHILVHEDVGMMIKVNLSGENGVLPGVAVKDYPPKARECIDNTNKPLCPPKK